MATTVVKIPGDGIGPEVMAVTEAVIQAAGAGTKLLITGHSKGGGVAPLAAMRLWKTAALPSAAVTFAAPHAVNPAFADLYGNAA